MNMPYPEYICAPMRDELTSVGFQELKTPEDVDNSIPNSEGTVLLVMNSVCGCAAGTARPGVRLSLNAGKKPSKLMTVFAGQDLEATSQARKYTLPYPPSSPAIALFKDGKLVHFIERHHIEGRSAEMIAENLKMAFDEFC
ncbi:MAG: BrxA/BrxB family bacilliredoxin [Bacteroidetes bacterium]|nr:BrxA/BrxB family bacilliredoxin [Bacteroidota bacterium]MBK9414190.1 BrxA/BrxB family bacilliredoxin [Bacteroidota bacterium]MBL0030746.1 BrxA/BrxB family bacilliredoxin [Bacteroidota bacterium]MBP6426162.1 BrxA/BrxB family bacilliredoxin [Bacteroidia bacterium]